ncbi:MAG: hypothetical protein RIB03_08670 [Henriciella sp.]|uniref:hypothetical protein n=1 Tax=Henriciella sp. TaxID=1968823 RepID=UPI0032ECF078
MNLAKQPRQTPLWPVMLFIVVGLAYALTQAGPVLSGDLRGSDDMMRMQQVRDLIAGQSWYDVDQARLYTTEGGAMHWSRLPDIFLAGIVLLTQPLIGREMAEGLAMTVWPLMQLGWVLTALAACLRRLNAPLSGQLAGIFFFCTSAAMVNFLPGRIDHHGLGIALTLTALACLLSPRLTARSAAIAALCVAALITVAIENLPAAGLVIFCFGFAWLIRGEAETNRLRFFGGGLIVTALIAYVFDAPGAGGHRAVCDAYGQSHFVALLVAGAGLSAIATVMPHTHDWRTRLIAMGLAGAMTLVSFVMVNPDCIGSPYAALPENVRSGWLSVVSEARPFTTVIAKDTALALFFYGFALAGLVCAIIGLARSDNPKRLSHGALLLLLAVAFILTSWQLRAAALAHALSAIACGWVFGWLFSRWHTQRGIPAVLVLTAGALAISPLGWTMASRFVPEKTSTASTKPSACKARSDYNAIVAAPRMIVFTPIDLGAPLLYYTRNYATAAPYHRNPSAIEMTLAVFRGPTSAARERISMTGATHLLFCPGLRELETYAKDAPDGFAADLVAGRIPNWLVPLTRSPEGEEGPIIYTIAFDRN